MIKIEDVALDLSKVALEAREYQYDLIKLNCR
jgi:hypothetical protein